MKQIRVIVFKPASRPFFHAQWTDPVTGKKKDVQPWDEYPARRRTEAGAL